MLLYAARIFYFTRPFRAIQKTLHFQHSSWNIVWQAAFLGDLLTLIVTTI